MQEIGIRTLMNVLGPMTNPAGAKRQVIGVFSTDWQLQIAAVLKLLGSEHALIVHSNGLDEIRLDAPTHVVELKNGSITQYDIAPSDFGISPRSPQECAGRAPPLTRQQDRLHYLSDYYQEEHWIPY